MDFANELTKLCFEHFQSLPKKGKPQRNKEWTLLAAIVMSNDNSQPNLKVISMSTGTKCLGYSELSEKGDAISDSHAEVLARRGFVKFLLHQMHLLLRNQNSEVLSFQETSCKFSLKPGLKFHLFISHAPCGDAAIFPIHSHPEGNENGELKPKRIKLDYEEIASNVGNVCNDMHRTGAKCVGDVEDPRGQGAEYHVTGVLRTKPGRGSPTWSMSCSDKVALWNACGMQGGLLGNLLAHPLYLASLVFGKCPLDRLSVQRAVTERLSGVRNLLPPGYSLNAPLVHQSSLPFPFSKESLMKENEKVVPCPAAIIWCDGSVEVSVNGKKQGITKKDFNKPSSRISVCRSSLFEKFLEICELLPDKEIKSIFRKDGLTYLDCKQLNESYQEAKATVFKIFDKWKQKPPRFQKFTSCVKDSNKNI